MKKTSLRTTILRTASHLFYKQGYSNTGINQIIQEAGIAKSTLYQQFRSKEELLLEYLDETGAMTIEALRRAAAGEADPKKKLPAIFDHLAGLAAQEGYYGCHFLNIVYEMPGDEVRVRAGIKRQKDAVRALFREVLTPLGRQELADEIYTLFEGALVGQKIHQDVWPIEAAKNTISRLF
jgi:AcrR family transcriptional regulator